MRRSTAPKRREMAAFENRRVAASPPRSIAAPLTALAAFAALLGLISTSPLGGFLSTGEPSVQAASVPFGETRQVQLKTARRAHTATELADGRILIAGGENKKGLVKKNELFDPLTGTSVKAGKLATPRIGHSATRLPDGRILVAGGRNASVDLNSTEMFDPVKRKFTPGPKMLHARSGHTSVALQSGLVLIFGGDGVGTGEVFDPDTDMFIPVRSRMVAARLGASAVVLQSGDVLIVGGRSPKGERLRSAEVFSAASFGFSATAGEMSVTRSRATLNLLPDGKVQVIGGESSHSMEIFSPSGMRFAGLVSLPERNELVPEVLQTPTRSAIIHARRAGVPGVQSSLSAGNLAVLDRDDYSVTEMNGAAFVAGGLDGRGTYLKSAVFVGRSTAHVTTPQIEHASGEWIDITGSGWKPGEGVYVTVFLEGGESPGQGIAGYADDSGALRGVQLPTDATRAGSYLITAVGQSSGLTAQSLVVTTQQDCPDAGSGSEGVDAFIAGCTECTSKENTCNGNFMVELVSVTRDGSLVTYEYEICNLGGNPAISHFVLGLAQIDCLDSGADLEDLVVSCTRNGGPADCEVGIDPTTGLVGAKIGTDGAGGMGECETLSFTLDESKLAEGQELSEGCIVAATKAGDEDIRNADKPSPGYVCISGPVCKPVNGEGEEPVITCPDDITVSADPGGSEATVSFTVSATGDPTPTIVCKIGDTVITSPHTFPVGTTTVTCTATNSEGSDQCSFDVTVTDDSGEGEEPEITCQDDITVSADSGVCEKADVSFTVTATGDPTPTIVCKIGDTVITSPHTFPVGTTTVTCTATNTEGSDTCSFDVTVEDDEPPTIQCPADFIVGATTSTGAFVNFSATAMDNCPGATAVCTPPSGSFFPIGENTVTCVAMDASGNQSAVDCEFEIIVQPQEPPPNGNGEICIEQGESTLIFDPETGEFIFCCANGVTATGIGMVTIQGSYIFFTYMEDGFCISAQVDLITRTGIAALKFPMAVLQCTIRDMNIDDNECDCGEVVDDE